MHPVAEDHVRMRALRLEAVVEDRLGLLERHDLGEAEIEHDAHLALAKIRGHLVLGRILGLGVPRLLLLRELLGRAQRVAALGAPVRMDVDHLHGQCPAPRYVCSIRLSRTRSTAGPSDATAPFSRTYASTARRNTC